MPTDTEHIREVVERVFARPEALEACRTRDFRAMLRLCKKYGITQSAIAGMTGLGQPRLSEYSRGARGQPTLDTLEAFANGLALPLPARRALGLVAVPANGASSSASDENGFPADTFDLLRLAEAIGRRGRVKRRDMLALAATLGAGAAIATNEVWERIAHALTKPSGMDESMVRAMEARSAGFHQLEELVPAQSLYKGLTTHLREVGNLLSSTPADPADEYRRRLVTAIGESSVLAGWLASDTGDATAAQNFYKIAMQAAEEANDPGIAACALAYRSYVPSTKGAHGRARLLLISALEDVSASNSPATLAWLSARYAEESAALGDKAQALTSWGQAEEAFSMADTDEDRVWTRFMDQNRFDSYHISTLANIRRLDEASELATTVLGRLEQPERKKAVIILEDIATAHLNKGSVNEASRLAQQALGVLRETEFTMWLPRFGALAAGLKRWERQEPVRAFLEDYAVTSRQLAPSRP